MENDRTRKPGDEQRPVSRHAKMPAAQRAKQFMPFAALTGLPAALRRKEYEMGLISRAELSEETAAEIDAVLRECMPGDKLSVIVYHSENGRSVGENLTVNGTLERIDGIDRTITLSGRVLHLDDIIEIRRTEGEDDYGM